jgi:hypothetical protein
MAAQANARLSFEDAKIVLTVHAPVPLEKDIIDKVAFRVGPNFLQDVSELGRPPVDTSDIAIVLPTGADPALPPEEFARAGLETLAGLPPSSIRDWSYNPQAGSLTVSIAPSARDRIQPVLDAITTSENHALVRMTWKFLEFPAGMKAQDQIMNDMEFQMFTRGMSGTPGVNLVSYPDILARNGSQTTFRSVLDVNSTAENGETQNDFTGISLNTTPTCKGEVIVLNGTADIGIPAEAGVQHTMVDFSATLQDRQTLVLLFPSAQPGHQAMGTIQAQLADYSAGQPQQEDSGAVPNPPPPADPFPKDSPEK